MAGSAMSFGDQTPFKRGQAFRRTTVTFTTDDATGAVEGTSTEEFCGLFYGITTDPGSAAPTANWDIVVKDEFGVDMLGANGSDRHTSNSEWASASPYPRPVNGPITISITNAGNSKTGTIYIDHEPR